MTALVATELDGGILHMRLNRPNKKNALTQEMYAALLAGFDRASCDETVRVVMLSGEGDSFSGGNDIEEFFRIADGDPEYTRGRAFLHTIAHFEKPVVAAVHGDVAGIGATMLLHFDLVYAAESARLLMPFVQIAAVAEAGSSLLLPLHVGFRAANELLLLSEAMNARKALEIGFYNDVVPDADVLAHARSKAARIASLSPVAVKQTKQLIRHTWRDRISPTIEYEISLFVERLRSPEAKAILRRFLDRRAGSDAAGSC
jgi:enoyl-CoA hydratase/carnithine racemase